MNPPKPDMLPIPGIPVLGDISGIADIPDILHISDERYQTTTNDANRGRSGIPRAARGLAHPPHPPVILRIVAPLLPAPLVLAHHLVRRASAPVGWHSAD